MSWNIVYTMQARKDLRDIYEYIALELLVPETLPESNSSTGTHWPALLFPFIINWVNILVPNICEEIYESMTRLFVGYRHTQCDETCIQVNKDGYGPGHKSYLWVHTSSELSDCPPIIIFCYEETRGTDHLRRFLTDGNIPCDNGYVERIIRSYSVGRANWLFPEPERPRAPRKRDRSVEMPQVDDLTA